MTVRQRGFTLIEVLAASAATALVILAASAFMLKALSWFDELSAKVEINRHARETYNVLAFGGLSASTGNDGTKNLYSVRGFNKKPTAGLRSATNDLQYTSNNRTLNPDKFASLAVTCTGVRTPIPDCADAVSTKNVTGWIGSGITVSGNGQAVNGLTTEMIFVITDPFQAKRAKGPLGFSKSYHTIFTLNRDESDP